MAEGAALEMPYTGNRIGGSNPPLSAFDIERHWALGNRRSSVALVRLALLADDGLEGG